MNNNLKIVSIGPYSPYRGGISDFNHDLINQLKKTHNVSILNFEKLYPSIFFPGKSQYKNRSSDSDKSFRILNPLNIFSWKKAVRKINQMKSDIVIFSYWHPFFALMYSYIAKKIKTKKIYFLIHNAKPHQNFPFQKFLIKYMLQHATHLVVMNESEKQIIKSYNLKSEIIISFHPIYEIDFNINDRAQFKKELGVKSEPTILFFGLIRKYKGLDVLIKAVKYLKSHIPNIKVFVVGEPYTDMNFYLSQIKKYDLESSFILDLNFVSKERLKKYFLSSELIILPYKRGTQSGILSLSMNFNLPSIVTSRGGLKDYVIDKETGFIVNPDASEIATSIKSFFDKNMFNEMSRSISIHKKNFSWEEFEKNLKLND